MTLSPRLLDERRSVSYAVIFGVWAEVLAYCLLHDQYLVRIAPEHFTVYHPPLWGIESPAWLAAAWALRASVGPGIVLGLAALFIGRAGKGPRVPVSTILKGAAAGIAATEICGLGTGALAWFGGRRVYPDWLYPDFSRPVVTSQTIQLTCYLAGAATAVIFLGWLRRTRRAAVRSAA